MCSRVDTYKLSPNKVQRLKLETTLDVCRELYNCALEQRRIQRISAYEQMKQVTEMRAVCPEYRNVHVHVLQNVIKRLDRSFQSFFRRCKEGGKPGFPRFKARDRYDSFEFNNTGFALNGSMLSLSKIGSVRIRLSRKPRGATKQCRILRRVDGWFAQFVIEMPAPTPLPHSESGVGIDVGIEKFAALSTGDLIPNPRCYERGQAEIRTAQKRVARRKKGSRRRRAAVRLLRKAHQIIKNRRMDFLHKQSRHLVNTFGLIAVEKLNVKGLAGGMLAKQVHDVGWGTFLRMLSYKAEEAGRVLIEVNPAYTSQTCPGCGAVKKKALSERWHSCSCGCEMDRDVAAAKVILGRAGPSGANVAEVIACVA